MKRRVLSVMLAAVLAIGAVGCSSKSASSTNGGKSTTSKRITFVTTADAVGLSPILTNDSASSDIIRNVYETLFMRDPSTGEIKPLLAESYENPDPNKWIIKLKKNIKFQDGTAFNAAAVKYTFEKIMDPKTAAPRASLLKSVKSIETPDDYTVVINTSTPFGIMLTALAHDNLSIVSPTADKGGDINRNPVGAGTGPFKFKEWVSGDHITLEKNADYWGGAAKIDTFVAKVAPEAATAVSMVENGEADFLVGVPAEQLSRMEGNKDVSVTKIKANNVAYVSFNVEKKPFDNVKVRQAIASAIDRDAYIATLNGLAYKTNGVIGPQLIGYDKSIEDHGFKFDVAKAKQLLAEAGLPDGFKTTLTYGNTDAYAKMAPYVQAQLKQIGIEVTLNPMDWAASLAYEKAGKQDMFLNGWANVTGDGEECLYPNLFSGSINASNYTRFNDKAGDALILKSRNTVDQKERLGYLKQANEFYTDNVGFLPMYNGIATIAVRKNVKGIILESNTEFRINNAYKE
jgi:peptide/nickel transport system substrate-binding protein